MDSESMARYRAEHEPESGDAVGLSDSNALVIWHDTNKEPLCRVVAMDRLDLIAEGYVEIAVELRGAKGGPAENNIWYERYIAQVNETGEMEDYSGNPLGFDWDDVAFWKELDELPAV